MSGSFLGPALESLSDTTLPGILKFNPGKTELALDEVLTQIYIFEEITLKIHPVEENGMIIEINNVQYLIPINIAYNVLLSINQTYQAFIKIIDISDDNRAETALKPIMNVISNYRYVPPQIPINIEA